MKVAITGVAGYLGRVLTPLLAEDTRVESIVGIDLKPPPYDHEKFQFVRCDVRDEALSAPLRHCDTVVHLREVVESPILVYVRGNREGIPLVHEDDVARAFATAVFEDHPGAFNIHAGNLSVEAMERLLGTRAVGLPFGLARLGADVMYKLGLTSFSGHWVELARQPIRISTAKAHAQLGWQPTKTAEQAFLEMVHAPKPGRKELK